MVDIDKFFEIFKIDKHDYLTPSRTVDEDGEISEFYVEKFYPSLDPNFIDLLDFYTYHYDDLKLDSYELKCQLCEALINKCNLLEGEEREEFIRDVKDIVES